MSGARTSEAPAIPRPRSCPDCETFSARSARIAVCRVCGAGRTLTPVNASTDQDYVSMTAEQVRFRRAYFDRLYDLLLSGVPPGDALDVGCGRGQLLDVLEAHGHRAQGLDAFAGAAADPRITCATLEGLAVYARFDLVTLVHSFEHLADPRAALGRLWCLLRPGGHLAIAVPNFGGLWSRVSGAEWASLNPDEHYFHYTHAALVRTVREHGFDVLSGFTCSQGAPSLVQAALGRAHAYQRVWLRPRPVRSVVFHGAELARRPLNWLCDRVGMGAELYLLARKPAQAPTAPSA